MRRIGQEIKIATGAVVYRDVPEQSLATGNPAKCSLCTRPKSISGERVTWFKQRDRGVLSLHREVCAPRVSARVDSFREVARRGGRVVPAVTASDIDLVLTDDTKNYVEPRLAKWTVFDIGRGRKSNRPFDPQGHRKYG